MNSNGYETMSDESAAKLYYARHPEMGPSMLATGFPQEMVNDGADRYARGAVTSETVMTEIRAWLEANL